jgi:hypothetical protein
LSNFDATVDYDNSVKSVEILINLAEEEVAEESSDNNRLLFLKLGIVLLVTRLQVFVQSILDEFLYKIKSKQRRHGELPLHLRLNAIRYQCEDFTIIKKLQNQESYDLDKMLSVREHIGLLNSICNDQEVVISSFAIDTKFPLGKSGLNELQRLFKQIDGTDIFTNASFDIEKLNGLLGIRHAIIHEDQNPHLTEKVVWEYKDFVKSIVDHIDSFLSSYV